MTRIFRNGVWIVVAAGPKKVLRNGVWVDAS